MKKISTLLLFVGSLMCLCACTNNTSQQTQQDTINEKTTVPVKTVKTDHELLLEKTNQVLTSIKNKDYNSLSEFVHPISGVLFSPYGWIDTTKNIKFSAAEFLAKLQSPKELNWGIYDGSGKLIILTSENYFKKFVYAADFLHADSISINKVISKGNSRLNLNKVFNGCDFTESYFAGFDKKYEGMDWKSLILVFKKYKGEYRLVAITNRQWTI